MFFKSLFKKIRLPRVIRKNPYASIAYAVLVVAAAISIFLFILARTLPSIEEIENRQVAQSTKILDRTGEVVLYEISGGERRTIVPLSEMSRYLKDATIAIEDKRFYEEPGVSLRGILRAVYVNLINAEVVQGGSTITQQLARNAFLTLEQTPTRKLKELILALRIDKYYTKDQILEFYLNEIPYGPNIYGVEAASQAYFAKPVNNLTLAESAILAAIPKAPSYYSPWGSHSNELISRQKLVLKTMEGQGKISKEEMDSALNEQISFEPQKDGIKAPHFVFAVQDYLTKKYGEEIIRKGGLRVITTLNYDIQKAAEEAVEEGAERNAELYGGENAALVAEDPRTGQILAMVGSRDFFNKDIDGNFNVATQGLRQPGSAIKPFIYLAAFEKGYTPDTVVFDVPTEFVANSPNCPITPIFDESQDKCFHPQNFDHTFSGPVNLHSALARSMNIPSVKTLYLVGIQDALSTLSRFGISTLTDPRRYGLSLVLGGGEVKLVELIGAYSVLAADGTKHEQAMIMEIKDSKGEILESFEDKSERIIESQSPRLVNNILSDLSARAALFGGSTNLTTFPGREIALKTGTTNNYRDAWTVGYTPSIVAGVWAGNNNNEAMHKQGSSILAALPIWNAFMKNIIEMFPVEVFERPEPVYPEKPILRGEYLADYQIHNILYHVDKDSPTGAAPVNPEDDPQFNNWENGVIAWAMSNLPDYSNYNNPNGPSASSTLSSSVSSSGIKIQIISPSNGSFVGVGSMEIKGNITSPDDIVNIRVYLNGLIINEFPGNYAKSYNFSFLISPQSINLQNVLEIEGISFSGASGRSQVIIYKN